MSHQRPLIGLFLLLSVAPVSARAGEWPQILGPHRNGHAEKESLADSWPNSGPPVRWERKTGSGFAGVVVADQKVILVHRQRDQQLVEAFESVTGNPIWKHASPTSYTSAISEDDGPRCVPLVAGPARVVARSPDRDTKSRVIVFGAQGDLICLGLNDGKEIWRRDTHADFDVPDSYFGAGSTPIVVGENVLVNVGGRKGGIVAFALADGKTAWHATDEAASYSSPILTTHDGISHAVFITRLNVVSVDPATGKERFRFPFGKRGPTVNATTPLVCDGRWFFTASYGIGAVMVKPSANRVDVIWENADAMASQYSTSIYKDGHLYGVDGRADAGSTELRCLDAKTGKILWRQPDFGTANLIYADEKLLAVKDDGTIVLAKVSPQEYRQLASAKVHTGTTRALPALANGRLYVRDSTMLKCLDLGPQK